MIKTRIPGFDPRPYWRVVEDCLVELFGMSRSEAKGDVAEMKARLKALPPDIDRDIIYHDEPLNVASRWVGEKPPYGDHGAQYERILERHYPQLRTRHLTESMPT
jgi:hypothetical protein